MKFLTFLSLVGLFWSCSSEETTDNTTPPQEDKITVPANSRPSMADQTFTIRENPTQGTTIGVIESTDAESDALTFSKAKYESSIYLNTLTGELLVLEDSTLFDYETAQELSFEVSVTDGKASSSATINLAIENEEDGPLSNYQKDVLSEFKYMVLNYENENPDFHFTQIYKHEGLLHLYLDGNVTVGFRNNVEAVLELFNPLFSDDVQIDIVKTLEESDVHVYLSPIEEIKDLWPHIYDFAVEGEYGGVASGYLLESGESKGLIWVGTPGTNIFSHELGHILGLSHSSFCAAKKRSMMCASALPSEPLLSDLDVLRYLYNPSVYLGMPASEIEDTLTNLLLGLESNKARMQSNQKASKIRRSKWIAH